MKRIANQVTDEDLFVGFDLHKHRWHVTIKSTEVELFSNSIVGKWENLRIISGISKFSHAVLRLFMSTLKAME